MPEISIPVGAIFITVAIVVYVSASTLPYVVTPWKLSPVTYNAIWYVPLVSAALALLEIEIEGASPWAARLPTVKVGASGFTMYHVFFALVIIVLSFNVFVTPAVRDMSVDDEDGWWKIGSFIQGSLLMAVTIFLLEDILWYMFNPATGGANLRPLFAPHSGHTCIKIFSLHLPVIYLGLTALAAAVGISTEETIVLPAQILTTVIIGLTFGIAIRKYHFLRRKGRRCAALGRPAC